MHDKVGPSCPTGITSISNFLYILVYISQESQWANVPLLGLVEKGFGKDEYNVDSRSLVAAENFDPEYIKINPDGTVPSLVSEHLSAPLTDTRPILEHIDGLRPSVNRLAADDPGTKAKVEEVISLVHDENISTNLVLLQPRDEQEMAAKRDSIWRTFMTNRQSQLQRYQAQFPDHPFFNSKLEQNTPLHELYTSETVDGPKFDEFFKATHDAYREFAAGLDRLNSAIVLPYAAGEKLTYADLHVVPWLAHAMWGAGATNIHDFGPLEALIGKTVPGFKVGDRIKEWWMNMSKRDSFKEVYPNLH